MRHGSSVQDTSLRDGGQAPDIALCKDQKPGRAREASDITDEMITDVASAALVSCPQALDVVVATNPFGDIFSNRFAALGGGLGIERCMNA
jgi:isocitrate/isopropylmalate dehydrogenase